MKVGVLAVVAGMTMVTNAALAGIEQCAGTVGTVTGSVKTINLNETTQTGFVDFTISSEDGTTTYFSKKGVIVGEVVDTLDFGAGPVPAALDHNMFFGRLIRLATHGDTVDLTQFYPVAFEQDGTPCAFNVVETITSATGTRRLRMLSNDNHAIIAAGTVSFCQLNNQNNFVLSGSVCID